MVEPHHEPKAQHLLDYNCFSPDFLNTEFGNDLELEKQHKSTTQIAQNTGKKI